MLAARLVLSFVSIVGAAPSIAQAQAEGWAGGVVIGPSLAFHFGEDADNEAVESVRRTGEDVGAIGVRVGRGVLVPWLSAHAEILIHSKGADLLDPDGNDAGAFAMRYLEFPIYARVQTNTGRWRAFGLTGPSIGWLRDSRVENALGVGSRNNDDLKAIDVGWLVGAGVSFDFDSRHRGSVELRYTHGLASIDKVIPPERDDDIRNQTVSILFSVGYGSASPALPNPPGENGTRVALVCPESTKPDTKEKKPVDGDSDKDGVADSLDQCRDKPEDRDGYLDGDGCPDLDNDSDGLADKVDKCPNESAEWPDGCPHEYTTLKVDPAKFGRRTHQLETTLRIGLPTSKRLDSDAKKVLDDVAQLMGDFPTIRVRLEGHTDRDGDPGNQRASERRADTAKEYLVDKEPSLGERVDTVGRSSDELRYDARDKRNRRVEVWILESPGAARSAE